MASKQQNRVYTEQDKIHALSAVAASGGNISRAARACGIPRKTVDQWSKGISGVKSIENLPEKVSVNNITLADKFEALAHAFCDAAPGKLGDAKLQNVMVSAAIAVDKAALLRGQPTSITENRTTKTRLVASIEQVILDCRAEGIEIDQAEAVRLLKRQVDPADVRLLDEILVLATAPAA